MKGLSLSVGRALSPSNGRAPDVFSLLEYQVQIRAPIVSTGADWRGWAAGKLEEITELLEIKSLCGPYALVSVGSALWTRIHERRPGAIESRVNIVKIATC